MKKAFKELFRDAWNVPNVLTMFRLVLVPVFIVLYLSGHPYGALVVFCIASLTDMLDGYIARTTNQITAFGKLMDPLADKLLVLSALICHGIAKVFPWSAMIMVMFKDMTLIIGALFMLGKKNIVVKSNWWGKTSTCLFIAALIAGFFHSFFASWGHPVDIWLLWMSVGLAYAAATSYLIETIHQIKKA